MAKVYKKSRKAKHSGADRSESINEDKLKDLGQKVDAYDVASIAKITFEIDEIGMFDDADIKRLSNAIESLSKIEIY